MQKLIFIFSLLFLGTTWSQNTISGKITSEDNKPVIGAHIHSASRSTNSDNEGNYLLSKIPTGTTKIRVTFIGFKTIDTLVAVNSNLKLNFVLKTKIEHLKVVNVKGKINNYNNSVAEKKVKTEIIERSSSLTLGDALKSVAGVSILKTGSTVVKPIINGLHSNRVPIFNNNVRLEDQQWGSEHAPNFDINSAGKITVIKGASALQFGGDAIGGLVVIEPTSVMNDTLFGKTLVTLASNGRGGTISTSLHKGNFCDWSWNVQGSFKYFGDREAPDYILSNTGNREANFSGDIKYIGKNYDATAFYSFYNTAIGILRTSHIGNVTDLYYSIQNQVPSIVKDFTYSINNPKQEVQHHLAKINYNRTLNESTLLSLQYAFQRNSRLEYDVRRGELNEQAALDLTLNTHTLNADFKKKFDPFIVKTGALGSYQTNDANPATGIIPIIPTYNKTDFGLYSIAESNLSETLFFEAGVRYDYSQINAAKWYIKTRWIEKGYNLTFPHFIVKEDVNLVFTRPSFDFHNFSATTGFHKTFNNQWDGFINISYAMRNPNPAEFFSDGLHHSTGMIELGDLNLKQEKSIKGVITIQKKWQHFKVNLNPFLNSVSNFMFLKPIKFETSIRGTFPVWQYQQTNALLTGVDLETNWDITSNLKHLFSLSYVNGKDLTNNNYLIDMPPLTINSVLRFSKKEWNQLNLEFTNEWVVRRTRFPDYNFLTNIRVNDELTPVLVDISTPPKGYHLMHFYSDINIQITKKLTTTVALSVQNLFNTTYRDYLNRQRFFVDEMGRNIQLQLKINY